MRARGEDRSDRAKVNAIAGDVDEAQTAHRRRVAALNAALAEGEQSGPAALFDFDRILNRKGGQPPQPGDELPDGD